MTIPALLASLASTDPGRPLVTFYDERTGERVELSVTTWANWVAKAASLLVDECDRERGDTLTLDLPPHWLTSVFAAAAWTAGLRVVPTGPGSPTDDGAAATDAVVCGPHAVAAWAPYADRTTVLACALLPLGVRFADPLPAGVLDVGVEIWSQPDAFLALDPPTEDEQATPDATQGELLTAAGTDPRVADGDRLLVTGDLGSADGLALLVASWSHGASLVLAVGADEARLDALAETERVTRRVEL
ncbi:TIGR03089 family protein [Nocardioides sp. CFH 31398]|uniref:TIGR03089 family protein n=1 Tax=Nocardioides sp. CFH 31398 TaxID=2919579 RepID=UPI001F05420D|nr:TIGR03089 family protein [Nocardioides sp. CFH 31398]MCH1866434.1 TIGR03089 family protein [Nocardioides sp. CFH 31398]